MPRGDRTGPAGMGPMTGRAMGYCAGNAQPGYASPGFGAGAGLGFGRGFRGGGWGRRNMYYATGLPAWARYGAVPGGYAVPPVAPQWPAEDEAVALKQEAEMLEASLNNIKQRLDQLAGETGEE